ncbi:MULTISPECIES: hypothetical protein [unclassified Nonomuraea]|uniref:hypothetical protein n=1 Tax=unclassified Nonomuraea TaxID=2593643 RepID=UPI0033F8869B
MGGLSEEDRRALERLRRAAAEQPGAGAEPADAQTEPAETDRAGGGSSEGEGPRPSGFLIGIDPRGRPYPPRRVRPQHEPPA